ncbi:hypothetical protein QAD02_003446 [Eretmocerus hayati]|uniref:Uncharacterized protein n=1 Tax=Eretmocerus hayati TaxID=131215 RepID=A0ACC2NM65_9HYME|nr:hypothetical protein QAD02_003446 [Eretmocerus hayati]
MDDPRIFLENLRNEGKTNIQPYLLVLVNGKNRFFFVVAENAIFGRKETTNVTSAFDLLFKVFHDFNLDYPPQILFSYRFIESFIYKCREYTNGVITSLYVHLRIIDKVLAMEDESDPDDSSSDASK